MTTAATETTIAVLVVDDQELVRGGLRRILRRRDGFVITECADGDEVVPVISAARPDVILMDLRMKRVGGIEATRLVRMRADAPPVLVLTTFDDDQLLSGALRAGAAGFILKDSPAEDLIRAVRTVAGRRRLARSRGDRPGAVGLSHRAPGDADRCQARRADRPRVRSSRAHRPRSRELRDRA